MLGESERLIIPLGGDGLPEFVLMVLYPGFLLLLVSIWYEIGAMDVVLQH